MTVWVLMGPRHKAYDAQVRPDLRGGEFEREMLALAESDPHEPGLAVTVPLCPGPRVPDDQSVEDEAHTDQEGVMESWIGKSSEIEHGYGCGSP